jgi:long-chain acyl-CoA synthetase
MREIVAAPLPSVAGADHLLFPLIDQVSRAPARPLAAVRVGDRFVDVSAAELLARVRRLAKGLIAEGVAPGDRVALMARTRLEWLVVDFATLAVGAATVPIYDTSSAEQMHWIIGNSGARMLVVETEAMRAAFDTIAAGVLGCNRVVTIDGGGLDELTRGGEGVADGELDERIAAITPETVATIVYTSGTTGPPKGCVLTHGNLRTNVRQSVEAIGPALRENETSLLFLPLAHSMTKANAMFGIETGIRAAFATDIAHLPEELAMVRPTIICAVPRIFEKVFNSARHHAHADRKGFVFDRAADVAIRWSQERTAGRVRPWTAAGHALFAKLVYGKVRAAMGAELRLAFSGGAPLGERLTHFFAGIGLDVFEGYGLTETSPTLTVNRPGAWKPGTVGRPVAGTAIRIADDGEILAKGPQVFQGYWQDPEATAEVFDDDGWFRTGDIGEVDDDGFLRITGRKKELLVTAAGKNVAPAPLEDRLRAHELISQAIVVGDTRPFIAALVTLDEQAVTQWAELHGHRVDAVAELADHDALRRAIQEAIDDANRAVSRAESIREFAILPRDLSIDAGELTPTLKVRRAVVEKTYADVIEAIYR